MNEASEINVFTLDANGFKTHWRIGASTTEDQLNELVKRQVQLSSWLITHNYTPDTMGGPSRGGNGSAKVAFTPAVWELDADGTHVCSVHGPGKFVPPGTSKKTGKPYSGFWACTNRDCKPQEVEP